MNITPKMLIKNRFLLRLIKVLRLTPHQMTPIVVSFSFFMESLDATILNTGIPAMAHSLNIDPINLKLALISYLVTLAVFIPISGWVADKYSVKRVFLFALYVFLLSSIACGFSKNLMALTISRVFQGIGGAFMLPVGRLIVLRSFPREELVKRLGQVIMLGSFGMMLGPFLGGMIVYYTSWQWIFWINIPMGVLTIVLAHIGLINFQTVNVPSLDIKGFILFGLSLASLTLGLSTISDSVIPHWVTESLLFIAILLLYTYMRHSQSQKFPIIKIKLFQYQTFKISVIGNLVARLGFGGIPFLLPLMLQLGLGYDSKLSGELLMPLALGILFIKPAAPTLLRLLGYRRLLMINTSLVGLSIWSFILINEGTHLGLIASLIFIFGLLVSLQYSGMNSLAYLDIEQQDLSAATSIMGTVQQLAMSFGVAISAGLIRYLVPFTSKTPLLTMSTFHHVFFGVGFITLLSICVFIRIRE